MSASKHLLTILFGSQGGNAKNLAHTIGEALAPLPLEVVDMGNLDPEAIRELGHVLIVTSTYGDGEAPDNASEWLSFLKFEEGLSLEHLKYAVLGLGDTYYPHFCQCGKDFDEYLSKRGAFAMVRRLDCDLYYEEQYGPWLEELRGILKNEFPT